MKNRLLDHALRTICAGALFVLLVTATASAAAPVEGLWLTAERDAIIEIAPCGTSLCGHLVWFENDGTASAEEIEALCGFQMLGGFRSDKRNAWKGGWLVDPEEEEIYEASIKTTDPDILELRVGFSVFTETILWRRQTAFADFCPESH